MTFSAHTSDLDGKSQTHSSVSHLPSVCIIVNVIKKFSFYTYFSFPIVMQDQPSWVCQDTALWSDWNQRKIGIESSFFPGQVQAILRSLAQHLAQHMTHQVVKMAFVSGGPKTSVWKNCRMTCEYLRSQNHKEVC